jgi:hypothetical protein
MPSRTEHRVPEGGSLSKVRRLVVVKLRRNVRLMPLRTFDEGVVRQWPVEEVFLALTWC